VSSVFRMTVENADLLAKNVPLQLIARVYFRNYSHCSTHFIDQALQGKPGTNPADVDMKSFAHACAIQILTVSAGTVHYARLYSYI
jgi:hypothetical protein